MKLLANLVVGFVALEHLGFLVLEAFLWQTPFGLKTFRLTPEAAKQTASLAMNQGLYNGFLAAGLLWAMFFLPAGEALKVELFFLSCVLLAGIVGALTAMPSIFFIQAVPALLALALVRLAGV